MAQEDFYNASLLWRAIIIKGSEIYGSDKAYELAQYYFSLGESLYEDGIRNDNLVGNNKHQNDNLELIQKYVDKDGNF